MGRYIIETTQQFITTWAQSENEARKAALEAFKFMPESAIKWIYHADKPVTAHRKPTPYEIKLGYGATHYREFDFEQWLNHKRGGLKKWIKCPHDGLRYYRG